MTKKPTRAPMPNLFLMVALFCLCLSWIWQLNDTNPDLTYSDVRQLILQEKVEELTVNDYTLTLKLREEVEGQSTIRYELYDFQYFYEDLGEEIQRQDDAGILLHVDYRKDHSTNWAETLVPLLVKDYRTVTLVDIRYVQQGMLGHFLEFHGQDVLFLYSTLVLNNSSTIK